MCLFDRGSDRDRCHVYRDDDAERGLGGGSAEAEGSRYCVLAVGRV
jgi:hypothetical protein